MGARVEEIQNLIFGEMATSAPLLRALVFGSVGEETAVPPEEAGELVMRWLGGLTKAALLLAEHLDELEAA